jgi:RNA polymerase sigma-70 factor (ECF subfamily)
MHEMINGYTTFTSERLLDLLKQDDPMAFEELYNRYWFKLFITAHKRLQCREDAEEAVQNLFESLWKNRHKIHVRTSLENYLFSAIRYIVLRLMYRKTAPQVHLSGMPGERYMSDFSTEETILVRDLSSQIEKIVESLPRKCRNVFEMSRYEMKTHKEISAIMGISEKTVENHITKALRLIKMNLNHFFFL